MPTVPFNMRIDKDMHQKLKYIAWYQRTSITEIISNAAGLAIADFEKGSGDITAKKLKDARII